MERADVQRWIDAYVAAWRSNDRDEIAGLFTTDAAYYTAPYREPWRGHDGIVNGWLDRKDIQGTWSFRYEVLGVDGATAFVRGWTGYRPPLPNYANLWVITFDRDGRASEFVEWFMEEPPSGA